MGYPRTLIPPILLLATIVASWAPARAQQDPVEPGPSPFRAEKLADGVHVMRPVAERDDLTNSLVVERDDGLLVVDSQPAPEAARELLDAVARLSSKPVRYLVLSHAHAETSGGASAFPETTLVIGTVGARDALRDPRFNFGAEIRARTGSDWKAPPIRIPDLVIHARTELEDPVNEVELMPAWHAHTLTDLVVTLPNQNILYGGALFFPDRNPYAVDADIAGWLGTLNHLIKLTPAVAVPLHGEPHDVREIRRQREALAWTQGQVQLGFIEQVAPEGLTDWVFESEKLDEHFDLETRPSFVRVLVDQVVAAAVEQRKKRGMM